MGSRPKRPGLGLSGLGRPTLPVIRWEGSTFWCPKGKHTCISTGAIEIYQRKVNFGRRNDFFDIFFYLPRFDFTCIFGAFCLKRAVFFSFQIWKYAVCVRLPVTDGRWTTNVRFVHATPDWLGLRRRPGTAHNTQFWAVNSYCSTAATMYLCSTAETGHMIGRRKWGAKLFFEQKTRQITFWTS